MKTTNRYLVATCGVLLHLMLGSTYAWSIYRNPIMAQTGWDQSSVSFAFSLAIFCLGLSAAFMGRLVEKFGPRVTGSMSAVLYAGGNILTGVAIAHGELWMLYLGYGILGGLGLGVGVILRLFQLLLSGFLISVDLRLALPLWALALPRC